MGLNPDGSRALTTAVQDPCARVWEVIRPALRPRLSFRPALGVTFSGDGRKLLAFSPQEARLWDPAGKPLGPAWKPSSPWPDAGATSAPALDPEGRTAAGVEIGDGIRVPDAATGSVLGPTLDRAGMVSFFSWGRDGRTLAVTGFQTGGGRRVYEARLWDAVTGKRVRAFPVGSHPEGSYFLTAGPTLSPDGKRLLTAGGPPYAARLWDVASGRPAGPPLPHRAKIVALAFSPDGKLALTASQDTTARLWDAATGAPVSRPLEHPGAVACAAFSPDGRLILTAGDDTARLWDAATGRPLGPPLRHTASVLRITFAREGRTALTADHDAGVWFWEVPAPLGGDAACVTLWAQVLTGLELDEGHAVRVLDGETWLRRRQELRKRGGPPLPN